MLHNDYYKINVDKYLHDIIYEIIRCTFKILQIIFLQPYTWLANTVLNKNWNTQKYNYCLN